MKLIKCKIYFTQTEQGTSYSGGYPKGWDSAKIPFIVYPKDTSDDGVQDEKNWRYIIALVPEDLYDKLIIEDCCEEVSDIEAEQFHDKHRPQKERITNPDKVISILAKTLRKEKLTKEEQNAIDPDNAEIGINKTNSFKDKCNTYGYKI